MKNIVIILLFLSEYNFSQNNYTAPELIQKSENQYKIDLEKSIVKNIKFEYIGPSVMSGRLTDIEVKPNSPTEFYVAYASGGLWHTTNNVTTFTPIMDNIKFKILNNDKRLLSNGEIKLDKGFNRLEILPVADKRLNQKQRQKLGITLKKADDGNVYFNKGKYIFSINNTSKKFLVK